MIGRLLCRLGFHKWEPFGSMSRLCIRRDCPMVETR